MTQPAATSRAALLLYGGGRSAIAYLVTPALIGGSLLALYVWINSKELDSIEQRRINMDFILGAAQEHIELTLISTVLVIAIAIPLGILLTRDFFGSITSPSIAVFNVGQATPTIALLGLIMLWWQFGFWPVIAALVAYTSLSVLRNTMVGLSQLDASVIESARGMGMSKFMVLWRIELPLAVPVIMAGVRTALVLNVGTATLAVFAAAGGLGEIINTGIVQGRDRVTIVGSVLTAALALSVDYVAGLAEDFLRPRGL